MNIRSHRTRWLQAGALALIPSLALFAQDNESDDEDDIYTLSPFEIRAGDSTGYTATSTLAGTRIRTDLKDIASPISVVTEQFLEDTAARSNEDLLQYTTSTEVGGLQGNFGGFGARQGLDEGEALLRPNNNTRVRGLDQADSTRNYYLSNIPWDSYNTDRIDIQRGPNSILFGVGSPAGIINNQTKRALLTADSGELRNELSKFGGIRWSFDYNKVFIEDTLAVRLAGLHSEQEYRQDPAFRDDKRIFGAISYEPQLLPDSYAGRLKIRGNFERGEIESNNPRVLPPWDFITLWFDDRAGDGVNDPIGMEKGIYDTFLMESGGFGSARRGLNGSVLDAFYVPAYTAISPGPINNGGVAMYFRNGESAPFFTSRQAPRVYPDAIGPDGEVDGTVSIPFGSPLRAAGLNAYSKNIDEIDRRNGDPSRFPLAARDYYRDRSLTDPTIFDFYNRLLDGDNKRERTDFSAKNISVSQSLFNDRLNIELAYDTQSFTEGRYGMLLNEPYISVDANANRMDQIPRYQRVPDPDDPDATVIDRSTYSVPGFDPASAGRPYPNPMAGAAFAFGSTSSNFTNVIDRDTYRATVVGEINASDFMNQDSKLARFLGRHLLTGLFTTEEVNRANTAFRHVSTSYEWAAERGVLRDLTEATREVTPLFYLTDPLLDSQYTTASGLNLDRLRSVFNPSGTFSIDYFDSNWKFPLDPDHPDYVDPASESFNVFGEPITASEDYRNYVGRTTAPGEILNALKGDFAELISDYSVDFQQIQSIGLTWQGYFLDGLIVPTVGWREDRLERYDGKSAKVNGVATQHAVLEKNNPDVMGDTTSWGVVGHMPRDWTEKVPGMSGLSAFYNEGSNSQVLVRYNFDGQPLDNPEADSQDYGIVYRGMDDRLSVELTRFETKVKNGTLPGGGNTPGLGENQYYIAQLEAWGTASALIDFFGYHGLDPNQNWYWNWAWVDSGFNSDILNLDPTSDEYRNHPSTLKQQEAIADFFAGMDQSFFDAYEIPIDVSDLQAAYATGDPQKVADAVAGAYSIGEYTTSIGSESNAQINGLFPTGSIDSVSEGYELEVNFKATENWEVQLNAAKTDAYRLQLGEPMRNFIAQQYDRFQGPAGDLRIWWAGERSIQEFYEENIISALEFLNDQIGQQVPELRPYRASFITNYDFNEGKFSGLNVGGSLRWQDKQIVGYNLKSDKSGLNAEDPLYGEEETAIDLWFGYERPLSDSIDWKIQLNLRNVGDDPELVTISRNPNGTVAAQRIREGMTWALTNTFSF